ncbi:hypothetical protein Golomagni_00753 [Golovinomyces magnicellulatus]|nr:hypothetical protein Golomagni_00753 [Golovinomyces magnicellulatus]
MVKISSKPKGRSSSVSMIPSTSGYLTPPASASPTRSSFQRSSPHSPCPPQVNCLNERGGNGKTRRRCSSLSERFPGDMSHRPLEQLRKEAKAANRAPHLKKKHIPGADTIDSLDRSAFGLLYHHGGPYDATLLARNRTRHLAPVEALKSSNNEALKATPREFIKASVERHLPLQGTAIIPPGMAGIDGQILQYEEGADLMREPDAPGGAYKRWPDMKYHPEDLKGKGEPSYSIEKALKKDQRQSTSGSLNSYEMVSMKSSSHHQRSLSGLSPWNIRIRSSWAPPAYSEYQENQRKGILSGQKVGEGLKKRFEYFAGGKKTNGSGC